MERGEGHASVYRRAVREALRAEMNRAIAAIYDATHVAVYDIDARIYCYGNEAEARAFADGLRRMTVREITDEERHALAIAKRQAYRNP